MNQAAARVRGDGLRVAALVGLAGLSLGACATAGPQVAINAPPSVHVVPVPVVPALQPAPKPRLTASAKPEKAGRKPRTKAQAAQQRSNGGRVVIGRPYQVAGVWYTPAAQPEYDVVGIASWYGDQFNGRATANGERFNMNATSAAHTTLPLPSIVEVTNLDNGRSIRVRLNDRGPFKPGRIIDLSRGAAQQLGYLDKGLARVRVRYVGADRQDQTLAPQYVARSTPAPAPTPAPMASFQLASAVVAQETPRPYPTSAKRVASSAGAERAATPRNSMALAYEDGMMRIALMTQTRRGGSDAFDAKLTPLW
jgi:rare lipoprotein A (peptidoglycan hydrolase)